MREMEVIHCHHLLMGLEMAYRYAHCPVVFTNHTRYDLYFAYYSHLSQPVGETVMRHLWPALTDFSDQVIAPSESVRDLLLANGVRRPISVIYNGIDQALFKDPVSPMTKRDLGVSEADVLIVYVGRLSAEKNLGTLLEEFAIARRTNEELTLLLVGDGPQRSTLKQRASELGIAAQTRFAGQIQFDDVPNVLAAADIFATASKSEVHPLTTIEALAAGLPVVATRSPGLSDIVENGVTGWLGSDREGEIARGLVMLSQDKKSMRQMGLAARMASARYSIDTTVSKTVEVYERLVVERPDKRRLSNKRRYRNKKREFPWQMLKLKMPRPNSKETGRHEH
jgi:glycosyltransferase involved in cell wall biosynthesis